MADNNISKNRRSGNDGKYSYKYTDIAQIHEYLESKGISYYQYIERIEGDDYIYTVPIIEGKELNPRRGCRVVDATLVGIKNPSQEQGSAITYARRYSLLMAFGLATEDDDAQCLFRPKAEYKKTEPKAEQNEEPKAEPMGNVIYVGKAHIVTIKSQIKAKKLKESDILSHYGIAEFEQMSMNQFNDCINLLRKYKDAI